MIYILVVLAMLKTGPVVAVKPFGSTFDCQVAEGQVATQLAADKDVTGYSFPVECKEVAVPNKV